MPATQTIDATMLQQAKQSWTNVKNNPGDTQAIEQFDSIWARLQGQVQQFTDSSETTYKT